MAYDPFVLQETTDKRLQLGRDRHQWVEGNFVAPDITDEHAILYSQTDGYIGTVLNHKSILHLAIALAIGFFIVIGRAGYLQVVHGASYIAQSDANRLRFDTVRSDRGLIYDRYQKPLVRNVPNYTISLNPKALPTDDTKRAELLRTLYQQHFINYSPLSLEAFITLFETARLDRNRYDKDIIVAESIPQDDAISLQILTKDVPAVSVDMAARREYLNEGPTGGASDDTEVYPPVKSLSHVLGYLTRLNDGEYSNLKTSGYLYNDMIGRTGLESVYESTLRGTYGKKEVEVDAQGRFKQVLNQHQATDGQSLLTSLDLELQRNVESILRKRLEEADKQVASVVILNPNNGDVLALVNIPTYDSNVFSNGLTQQDSVDLFENPLRPLFNRAISGEYPSGSTFKPIVAAAALEQGLVSQRTSYLSVGGIGINQFYFPDWKAGGHGWSNVYKAIAESVNTYFYIIGGGYQTFEGLGVERITAAARKYGLDKPLGIDLPSEGSGFLPSKEWKEEVKKERWYIGDTYHYAIGQGDLLVTPLQMAAVISSFANGGTLYQPRLVTATLDQDLRVVEERAPVVLEAQVTDPEALAIVRTGLRQVVTIGSGKRLNEVAISVSGKTGTAQWHSQKPPHAWFVGYAPSNNPSIAFSILVEEGEEGSALPVTIAQDILNWWVVNRQ